MRGRFQFLILGIAVAAALAVTAGVRTTAQGAGALSPEEQLGKSIFFDQTLSIDRNQSCASCHAPEVGWTGPLSATNANGAVYEGSIPGRFGNRKPPSAAYATLSPIFFEGKDGFVGGNFWDGRATGEKLGNPAADQAQGPFLNPKEQGLPDSACVVYRVAKASYPVSYADVWGDPGIAWPADVETACATEGGTVSLSAADRAKSDMAYDHIALSIAAFEGSPEVNAFSSKFDAVKNGMAKFTKEEQKGRALFNGKAGCARCHPANGQDPLFTDFTYDNLGIPANPENPALVADPSYVDLGLGGFLATRPEYAEDAEESDGMFKVPTLRNVDLRPSPDFVKAYGHNGYFKSLEEIVHFYNTRDVLPTCDPANHPGWVEGQDCWPPPEVPENVNHDELGDLGLSPQQEADVVAFLKTLSDGYAS